MRVFLDTNVLLSAFATRGLCADLFELVLIEHDLASGRQVIQELSRALRSKLKFPEAAVKGLVAFVRDEAVEIVARAETVDAAVEPDDARVLGEALAARADIFVTGDAALLAIGELRGMPIVSPRQFWEFLQSAAK